jgi:hypothetical protein
MRLLEGPGRRLYGYILRIMAALTHWTKVQFAEGNARGVMMGNLWRFWPEAFEGCLRAGGSSPAYGLEAILAAAELSLGEIILGPDQCNAWSIYSLEPRSAEPM